MHKSENWNYHHSKILNMDYAVHKTENRICVNDPDGPVFYNDSELTAISEVNGQITPELHMLKKVFNGTIEIYKGEENVNTR